MSGLFRQYRLLFLELLLPGVAGEGDPAVRLRHPVLQVALELFLLAVGQRVHGIDDDRGNGARPRVLEDLVHDGQQVGQALTRPGSRR